MRLLPRSRRELELEQALDYLVWYTVAGAFQHDGNKIKEWKSLYDDMPPMVLVKACLTQMQGMTAS